MTQELTQEEKTFLKKFASAISTPNGKTWYYMPLWFCENEDGSFESYRFETIPDELKIEIRKRRDP